MCVRRVSKDEADQNRSSAVRRGAARLFRPFAKLRVEYARAVIDLYWRDVAATTARYQPQILDDKKGEK